MLARRVPATQSSPRPSLLFGSGFLPFLYCTRTILRAYGSHQTQRRFSGNNDGDNGGTIRAFKDAKAGDTSEQDTSYTDKTASESRGRKKRATIGRLKNSFGRDGFKINEPWEKRWKTSPPPRRAPQDSPHDNHDDAYAPFSDWPSPATESASVGETPPKRIHRDASHVPFHRIPTEKREDLHADLEGATITPSEKRAFQALFGLQKPSTAALSKPNITYTKVGREDDDTNNPLDNVINKIATNSPSSDTRWSRRPVSEFPEPLKRLREATMAFQMGKGANISMKDIGQTSASTSRPNPNVRTMTRADERSRKTQSAVQREIFHFKQAIESVKTDVEVWNLLHNVVLKKVLALDLDGSKPPNGDEDGRTIGHISVTDLGGGPEEEPITIEGSRDHDSVNERNEANVKMAPTDPGSEPEATNTSITTLDNDQLEDRSTQTYPQPPPLSGRHHDLGILSVSFPQHMINTFTNLTTRYPGSLLPLNLIPLLKSYGPSTAALGLSTELYNLHLRNYWQKYRDLIAVDEILQEMNENVYEFDQITHNFVVMVLTSLEDARRGERGQTSQLMGRMDRALRGEKAIRGWMKVMTRRRYEEALRKAREKEVMERERAEEEENERAAMGMAELRHADEMRL